MKRGGDWHSSRDWYLRLVLEQGLGLEARLVPKH
jgi:hypothetical protein